MRGLDSMSYAISCLYSVPIRPHWGGKPMTAFSSGWFSSTGFSHQQWLKDSCEVFALVVPSTWNTPPPDNYVTYCLTFSKVFLYRCHFYVDPCWLCYLQFQPLYQTLTISSAYFTPWYLSLTNILSMTTACFSYISSVECKLCEDMDLCCLVNDK